MGNYRKQYFNDLFLSYCHWCPYIFAHSGTTQMLSARFVLLKSKESQIDTSWKPVLINLTLFMGNETAVMSPQRQWSCSNGGNKLFWLQEWIKYWMFHFSHLAAGSPKSVELIYTSSLEKGPAGPGVLTVRLLYLDQLIFCLAAGCMISLSNILAQGVQATQHGACILSNGNLGWATFQGKSLPLAFSKGLREFSAGFATLAPGTAPLYLETRGWRGKKQRLALYPQCDSCPPSSLERLFRQQKSETFCTIAASITQVSSLICKGQQLWKWDIHLCWSGAGWVLIDVIESQLKEMFSYSCLQSFCDISKAQADVTLLPIT